MMDWSELILRDLPWNSEILAHLTDIILPILISKFIASSPQIVPVI